MRLERTLWLVAIACNLKQYDKFIITLTNHISLTFLLEEDGDTCIRLSKKLHRTFISGCQVEYSQQAA